MTAVENDFTSMSILWNASILWRHLRNRDQQPGLKFHLQVRDSQSVSWAVFWQVSQSFRQSVGQSFDKSVSHFGSLLGNNLIGQSIIQAASLTVIWQVTQSGSQLVCQFYSHMISLSVNWAVSW